MIVVHRLLCPYRDVLPYLYTKDSIAVHVGCFVLARDWRALHGFMQPVCSCDTFLLLRFGGPLHPAVCLPGVLFELSWFPVGLIQGKAQRKRGRRKESEAGEFTPLPLLTF